MHKKLEQIIDFFYPPFKRLMPIQLFRYLACGGSNTLLDWVLYFVAYNYVVQKHEVDLGFVTLSPHIAAFVFTFPIVLMVGFYLSRNISFQGSSLRGRVQLFRYLVIVAANILINYICLKIFVDWMHIYPTPSKMLTTVFTTLFSYFAQKHYSFSQKEVI